MKTNRIIKNLAALALLSAFSLQPSALLGQGTAFTYQGRLNNNSAPANGSYDFCFRLAADPNGNTYVGSPVLTNGVAVNNGLFLATLDFGGAFNGSTYWLEVDVKTNGVAGYTELAPLQPFTPTPYAIMANSASNLLGNLSAGQLTGTLANGALPTSPNFSGTVSAGTFSGSGANLTSLNANNLASGTVPLAQLSGITGSQLAAATWQLATNLNGGNAALASNVVSGISITNATISGNGGGLTNVTAATLAIPQGMALIPAGTFSMGDSLDGEGDAMPTTNITVSAFYMDINLVSYAQWQSVFFWATNHGYGFVDAGAGKAANHPVQTVDWYDSVKWSNARSQQAGLTPVYYTDAGLTQVYTNGEVTPYMNMSANGYRLPTEAEWEKAARGGLNGQRFPWGNVITENLANYYGATGSYDLGPNGYNTAFTNGVAPFTSPVGYFAPNGYGLYDMADDVTEWCWDWYGTPHGQPTNTNPTGPVTGSYRVLRGGNWNSHAYGARCASRDYNAPNYAYNDFGFRCVRGH
jgi:formylglycine-generating enzyme required for sulfatase activity